MTGSGIVMKTAPNFPKTPRKIIRIPVVWSTSLLPTWHEAAGKYVIQYDLGEF